MKNSWFLRGALGAGVALVALYFVARGLADEVERPLERKQEDAPKESPVPQGFRLIFSEEFDGTALDRGRWCTRYIYGGGRPVELTDQACQYRGEGTLDHLNDEQQRYVDRNHLGQLAHRVRGGTLALLATKTGDDDAFPYESAMIRSKRLFRPDRTRSLYVTARVWLPKVKGTWPAFWLNSDRDVRGNLAWPPEIDIFEAPLNGREDRENMLHMASVAKGVQTKDITMSHPGFDRKHENLIAQSSLRERWLHTAILWSYDEVCYFLDGVRVKCERYRWVRNDGEVAPKAHLLMNLAVGGEWAGRHGIEVQKFPAAMRIDFVRVYEKIASGVSSASKDGGTRPAGIN